MPASSDDPFRRANDLFRKHAYRRWHRQVSKQHILRSQVGFTDTAPSRPACCKGCRHYHGLAYGTTKAIRETLICAMHPYGWQNGTCPDWQASQPECAI